MKFTEVAARLNGFSTPIFGVCWTPPTADVTVARSVLAFIEARRVLFAHYSNELPQECVDSVLAIRDRLTEVIGSSGIGPQLRDPLRLMRRYCVKFLAGVGETEERGDVDSRRRLFREPGWSVQDYWFAVALGELRAGVGLQAAIIAASFGLEVEDELAGTLPELEQ